tara:strand:+ start:745 stop:870 length:126 start_codon:yes stop_codon:yes gene_type:complete
MWRYIIGITVITFVVWLSVKDGKKEVIGYTFHGHEITREDI